jgi:hypothetical protein
MTKYTTQDIFDLENSLKSSDDILSAQEELFDEEFKEILAKVTERIYNLEYTVQEIHRHGVILGILLAKRKLSPWFNKSVSWEDWE